MQIRIRKETPEDYDRVYELIREAFAHAEHADGTEQDLVRALRKGSAFIPELSLIAEVEGKLAGHILFTKASVNEIPVLALAPLSVKPAFWHRGIGSALIREGHARAAAMGYDYSVVLGSRDYYPRFGYQPAEELGIAAPSGIPKENLMAIRLRKDAPALCGTIVYPPEFSQF